MHVDNQSNESALELRLKQITRYVTLGLLGVLALCALLFVHVESVKQSEKVAISNSQIQADQTKDSTFCSIYPNDEICVLSRKIAADPTQVVIPKDGINGEKGEKGDTGETGKGVSSFITNEDGQLMVTFSDGTTQNAGKVVGKNGIDGINGIDGADGQGILSAGLESGNLIIRFTDGSTQNLGMVVGPAGQNGEAGLNGADGISVINLTVDPQGYVQVEYSNGTSQAAGRVIVNTIQSLTCENDTLTITLVDGQALSTPVDCTPDNVPNAQPAPTPAPTPTESKAPAPVTVKDTV